MDNFDQRSNNELSHQNKLRRRSLVDDAKFDTVRNKDLSVKRGVNNVFNEALDGQKPVLGHLNDSHIITENVISVSTSLKNGFPTLQDILLYLEENNLNLHHLETRKSKEVDSELEVLMKLELKRISLSSFIQELQDLVGSKVMLLGGDDFKNSWFPSHVSDLDHCNHVICKYEPELQSDHPGFNDLTYRTRRQQIADISFSFKHGDRIPKIPYTAEEIQTWGKVFEKLSHLYPKHACRAFLENFAELQIECGYRVDSIPQLEDVSVFLQRRTGFSLRPAAGLISARDFLASLAFRVFQTTQYVRHGSSPHHSPEPDCIHELLGHIPMLADPEFAKLTQEIGLASLSASDEDIEKLATIYWFSIEFGLCREEQDIKAYGAGLLSSYGELQHALSGRPELKPFDPKTTSLQPYQDFDYQNTYYISEGFDDVKNKIRSYVATQMKHTPPFHYDPYTRRVFPLNSKEQLIHMSSNLKSDISRLDTAIGKIPHI